MTLRSQTHGPYQRGLSPINGMVAKAMRALRKEADLSSEEMAEMLGATKSYVTTTEGDARWIFVDDLVAWEEALSLPSGTVMLRASYIDLEELATVDPSLDERASRHVIASIRTARLVSNQTDDGEED